MKKKVFLLSVALAGFFSCPSYSKEITLTPDSRKNIDVTIYNGGLGLIKETRSVPLTEGRNSVAFEGVSVDIQPETALLSGNGISVLEQNFNFDLLSRSSLLQKFLGKDIQVVRTNPGNGNEVTETAKVLSIDAGIVLKIGNRIETDFTGRYIFPDIPENLRDKPTLVVDLLGKKAGKQDVNLTYLTNGLTWKADYVAELNEKENALALNGLVTLTNTTGVSYENADLRLVAGKVNRVRRIQPRPMMMKMARMDAMNAVASAEGMQEESLMDYHMYSLGRKTDILSKQTKQLAMMSSPAVVVEKVYRIDNVIPVYNRGNISRIDMRNTQVFLNFENSKKDGLGKPLPAGTVRVYKKTEKGDVFFVGEDAIVHTPENEKVKLKLGEAFDVTVSGEQVHFTSMGKHSYDAEYELIFKNAKDIPVKVSYYQTFPQNFRILKETIKSEQENASQMKWTISVPAKGETKLTFTVRVSEP